MTKLDYIKYLLEEKCFDFLGTDFNNGDNYSHFVKYILGKEYIMCIFAYSGVYEMVLQYFNDGKIDYIHKHKFFYNNHYKEYYDKVYNEFVQIAKEHKVGKRIKSLEKDF